VTRVVIAAGAGGVMTALRLYIDGRATGTMVCPDPHWPKMWRVHHGGHVSDMVNLARAKDASISWARPRGMGGEETPRWICHHRETPSGAPRTDLTLAGVPDPISAVTQPPN
jgi:hypothetical protein